MFSRLIDLSSDTPEPDALWLVISGHQNTHSAWATLVSAISYPEIGEFTFEFDPQVAHLDDSITLRYRDNDLNRMVTLPATIISRADNPHELSQVRVQIEKCCCGASSCQTATCFEAGTFVSPRHQFRAAA
jgi:hypothetical protein